MYEYLLSQITLDLLPRQAKSLEDSGVLPPGEAKKIRRALTKHNANSSRKEQAAWQEKKMFPANEVARLLNCSKRTVLRMADDGLLTRIYLRGNEAR